MCMKPTGNHTHALCAFVVEKRDKRKAKRERGTREARIAKRAEKREERGSATCSLKKVGRKKGPVFAK